jgi:HEAT repeat protein
MDSASLKTLIDRTRDDDPRIRRTALRELCPCDLKRNLDPAWDRVLEMVEDPDASVRSIVLHTLCDGSPEGRLAEVVNALEKLAQDPDRRLRRRARDILAKHRRTGRVNFL